jgi:hypothetical protein
MPFALFLNVFDVCRQLPGVLSGNRYMQAGVVADFKTSRIQGLDLLPRHVMCLVRYKLEALSDEKGGAESMHLEQGRNECGMACYRVIKRKDNDSVRVWFQRICLGNEGHGKK